MDRPPAIASHKYTAPAFRVWLQIRAIHGLPGPSMDGQPSGWNMDVLLRQAASGYREDDSAVGRFDGFDCCCALCRAIAIVSQPLYCCFEACNNVASSSLYQPAGEGLTPKGPSDNNALRGQQGCSCGADPPAEYHGRRGGLFGGAAKGKGAGGGSSGRGRGRCEGGRPTVRIHPFLCLCLLLGALCFVLVLLFRRAYGARDEETPQ